MGIISRLFNSKASNMVKEKHELMRTFERKEITEEEYNTKLAELEGNINVEVKNLLDKDKEKRENLKPLEEVNQMADEKLEKKKVEKPLAETSYTKLILKALAMKQTKSMDATADKVLEWRPGKEKKALLNQIKSVINLVKKQADAKRWLGYKWNEQEFLLEKPAE